MKFEILFDLRDVNCQWKGGKYKFTVEVPESYPMAPPKCHCDTQIYHPNIDTSGAVCLNILRADWKPVLNVYTVITGLHYLFIDPNPNDPLHHQAAAVLRDNPKQFATNVTFSL